MVLRAKLLLALALTGLCLSCQNSMGRWRNSAPPPPSLAPACPTTASPSLQCQILARQSCPGLGACQGASLHDGFVYLYGDLYQQDHQSGPGVIRQYSLAPDEHGVPHLTYTGLEILLTRGGQTLINHPTGLTWNPTYGTYLGNTVTKTKKGTIYHLNWTQMLIDRNLDHAVLNVIEDDLAAQGCRPEFVRHGGRWLLATADYGQTGNAVRCYDPALLASAKATSEPGVLVEQFPCTPWVQQLHWIDAPAPAPKPLSPRERMSAPSKGPTGEGLSPDPNSKPGTRDSEPLSPAPGYGLLILAQNKVEGRGWRLTPANPWQPGAPPDFRALAPYDDLPEATELEGFAMLGRDYAVLVNSSAMENVAIARVRIAR